MGFPLDTVLIWKLQIQLSLEYLFLTNRELIFQLIRIQSKVFPNSIIRVFKRNF